MIQQNPKFIHGALTVPEYPNNIPNGCKWLGGEGYGVWFLITKPAQLSEKKYRIVRYSHTGNLDCDLIFELKSDKPFFIDKEFEFAYISHCQKCTLVQNGNFFIFEFICKFDFK